MPAEISPPNLPGLREIIARYDLRADKSLGQHFLLDPHLLARIVQAAGPLEGLKAIEIGPGPGGLTRALLATPAAHVLAVEIDPRAIAVMNELATTAQGRLTVLAADAMKLDLPALIPAPRVIIANLPYNIGSPLLIRWLAQAGEYESMTLMFQLEVAQRISAPPGTGAYGRLSVLAQWLCEVTMMMQIPAAAFTPPPKVESAVLRLVPHAIQPPAAQFKAMERLTAAAFGQRRKMLRGSLRALGGEILLRRAEIAPDRRAETLSVAEFERLMLASLDLPQAAATP
jgi:16S rRNA (adenine1518-N6/adenine1519-N6)-dimethyltransferase